MNSIVHTVILIDSHITWQVYIIYLSPFFAIWFKLETFRNLRSLTYRVMFDVTFEHEAFMKRISLPGSIMILYKEQLILDTNFVIPIDNYSVCYHGEMRNMHSWSVNHISCSQLWYCQKHFINDIIFFSQTKFTKSYMYIYIYKCTYIYIHLEPHWSIFLLIMTRLLWLEASQIYSRKNICYLPYNGMHYIRGSNRNAFRKIY